MLPRLFIAALWSPEGKGLSSWPLFVMFIVILLLSLWYPRTGVWYLTVSIPDPCCLSYFLCMLESFFFLLEAFETTYNGISVPCII